MRKPAVPVHCRVTDDPRVALGAGGQICSQDGSLVCLASWYWPWAGVPPHGLPGLPHSMVAGCREERRSRPKLQGLSVTWPWRSTVPPLPRCVGPGSHQNVIP